jgi:hypothetical protein
MKQTAPLRAGLIGSGCPSALRQVAAARIIRRLGDRSVCWRAAFYPASTDSQEGAPSCGLAPMVGYYSHIFLSKLACPGVARAGMRSPCPWRFERTHSRQERVKN